MIKAQQFILWRKRDKIPVGLKSVRKGGITDPTEWGSYSDAKTRQESLQKEFGIGFVFTETDPYFFVDIDGAHDGNDWSPLAKELCTRFSGAYIEVSQSGTGLHIIGKGACPPHSNRNAKLHIELYTGNRYVALTENGNGSAETDHTGALAALVADHFQPSERKELEWNSEPVLGWNGPEADDELIKKALRSKANPFSQSVSFKDIWNNNEDALATAYPPDKETDLYNRSLVDGALAIHLAFWTGKNHERIRRIMRISMHVRDKWEREDYIHATISTACAKVTAVYAERQPAGELEPNDAGFRSGYQLMTAEGQVKYFNGCVYVITELKAWTPLYGMLNKSQFKDVFGGYVFDIDNIGRSTTKDAWEAFRQSQVIDFKAVHDTAFRPDLKPGAIIGNVRQAVNIYTPADVRRVSGDATPFVQHIEKLLSNPRDQEILLSYMAAVVQHKGVKFQWAPVIQGAQGNGKTMLINCIEEAVGDEYCHRPVAQDMGSPFNAWMKNKIFIGVDDVHISKGKNDLLELLKPMVSNDKIKMEPKGVDQRMSKACANFLFTTNHKDAIPIGKDDRRYCIFYTAQQGKGDIERDGMRNGYFPRLWKWLRADGFAIVHDYLMTYPISDEFSPAINEDAPITSSYEAALEESRSPLEIEVLEAIYDERQGFCPPWISSKALNILIEEKRMYCPKSARGRMLGNLGYVLHPGLTAGRVNNSTGMDVGKPYLYVKGDSPAASLTVQAEIAKTYVNDQTATEAVVTNVFNINGGK